MLCQLRWAASGRGYSELTAFRIAARSYVNLGWSLRGFPIPPAGWIIPQNRFWNSRFAHTSNQECFTCRALSKSCSVYVEIRAYRRLDSLSMTSLLFCKKFQGDILFSLTHWLRPKAAVGEIRGPLESRASYDFSHSTQTLR
jgi:hypothetical protein